MRFLIFIPLILSFSGCVQEENSTKGENYFSKILSERTSPNGDRKLTLGERGNDSTGWVTQLLVSFPGGVGAAYDAIGKNLVIEAHWKGNDTIVVKAKENYKAYQKHKFVQLYSEKVIIEYKEN